MCCRWSVNEMSRITTYLLGRDPRCHYRVDDDTVSRLHAELVPAPGGRFHVTDRASTGGTFVRRDRKWARIRQAWVGSADRIRFGGHELAVAELAVLRGAGATFGPSAPVPPTDPSDPTPDTGPGSAPASARDGKKARNARTGEIVDAEEKDR